jgi:hypothetical protein
MAMRTSLLGAAFAAISLALSPSAAWAQHGGHPSGRHGHSQPPHTSSHAHFHAPPYYLLRGRGYPYEYFAPGGYLDPYSYHLLPIDPYRSPALPYVAMWSMPANPYSPSAVTPAPDSQLLAISAVQQARPRVSIVEVRLQITPAIAAVFMDSAYVGAAGDYSGSTMLALESGRHHFEFRAEGYQPLAFDLDVPPGRQILLERRLRPTRP